MRFQDRVEFPIGGGRSPLACSPERGAHLYAPPPTRPSSSLSFNPHTFLSGGSRHAAKSSPASVWPPPPTPGRPPLLLNSNQFWGNSCSLQFSPKMVKLINFVADVHSSRSFPCQPVLCYHGDTLLILQPICVVYKPVIVPVKDRGGTNK
jgi:hypothetical protein